MKNYTYHFEVQSLVAQFMAALDDIVIKRHDNTRTPQSEVKVRLMYAPKQRVINDLTDKAQNLQLPVVSVSLGTVTRDSTRVYNKITGSEFNRPSIDDTRVNGFMPQPLPVDIVVNVDILTKFTEDMDQIITNFVPYCDPYFVISWRIPEMSDYEIRSIVNWSGTVNVTYPLDIAATTNVRVVGNTSFTIKGWLFRPIAETPLIFNITENMRDLKQLYGIEQDIYSTVTVHGKPAPAAIHPTHISLDNIDRTVTLYGDMFKKIKAVYLSGSAVSDFETTHNPFSATPHLSADFPEFTALKLDNTNFTVISENNITVTLPSFINHGSVDFIVENPAGYSTLLTALNRNNNLYTHITVEPSRGLIIG